MQFRSALTLAVLASVLVPFPGHAADRSEVVLERRAENNRSSDAPELNASASAWLVIHGHKPATLEVLFDMLYTTRSPDCQTHSLGSLLGGAPAVPQRIWERYRIAAQETEFTVRIPLDRFVPGSCKWGAGMLFDAQFMPGLADGPAAFASRAQFTPDGRREMQLLEACSVRRMVAGQTARTYTSCFPPYMGVPKLFEDGAAIEFTIKPIPDQITHEDQPPHEPAAPTR